MTSKVTNCLSRGGRCHMTEIDQCCWHLTFDIWQKTSYGIRSAQLPLSEGVPCISTLICQWQYEKQVEYETYPICIHCNCIDCIDMGLNVNCCPNSKLFNQRECWLLYHLLIVILSLSLATSSSSIHLIIHPAFFSSCLDNDDQLWPHPPPHPLHPPFPHLDGPLLNRA